MKVSDFQLYDSLQEAVIIVDEKLKPCYFNHTVSILFKAPPRVLKKANSLSEIIGTPQFEMDKFVARAFNEGMAVSKEVKAYAVNNSGTPLVLILKTVPLEVEGKKLALVSFKDVSVEFHLYDKYRLQLAQLKDTHEQIVHADKMASLGELTAGISHEISNPLTIAAGNLEVIQTLLEMGGDFEGKEQIVKSLVDSVEGLDRINKIIINMKSFLHKSEDSREYCRLDDIVDETRKLIAPTFKDSNVSFKSSLFGQDIVAFANKTKLEQVLVNLVRNAFDAIHGVGKENGEVSLEVKKDENGDIVITVADNGSGMSDEVQQSIFNTFFTTKDPGEGIGLGLSISKKIIEACGGKIRVDSEEGKGSVFQVTLPGLEVSSYTHNDRYLKGESAHVSKKILVVDNEVQVLNLLNKIFSDEGLVFVGSSSGVDALKILENVDVDLIITDINMPIMSGSKFAESVRNKGIDVPVLYLSSPDFSKVFNEDRKKFGVTGLILKPFKREEILGTINQALGESSDE